MVNTAMPKLPGMPGMPKISILHSILAFFEILAILPMN
jgi:hypothetical protein